VRQLFAINMLFLVVYHLISQKMFGQNNYSANYVGTFCVTASI